MLPRHYIFNHVPKTGGISLLALCRNNLAGSDISPHLWEHDLGERRPESFEHYRLVTGHFSILAQTGFVRDRYSMTLLRHPLRRIASAYEFGRRFPDKDQNFAASMAKLLSFPDYVRYFADWIDVIDNPYTHHFAAMPKDFPGAPENGAMLVAAKHNLSAFDFVGITEEFGASVALLCEELGWQPPATEPRENTSGSERVFDQIDSETMGILFERNRLDLELYEYARKLFHSHCEQAKTSPAGPDSATPNGCHLPNLAVGFSGDWAREANRFVPLQAPYEPKRVATIGHVSAQWIAGENPVTLEIAIGFRTKARLETLVAGVLIQDIDGGTVYGTNTQIEKVEVKNTPECDCWTAFVLDCALVPGMYFVTVALHDVRQLGFHYHWIDRATKFEVSPNGGDAHSHSGIRLRAIRSTLAD
jgi:hypothetical protein